MIRTGLENVELKLDKRRRDFNWIREGEIRN